jgi:hypothetical protein
MWRLGSLLLAAMLLTGCSTAGASPTPSASDRATSSPPRSAALVSPDTSGSPVLSPAPSPSPVANASPGSPTASMAPRPAFTPGAELVTITDSVRMRSRPEVSDASAKYDPTLPINTGLRVLAGPEAGSGYWWYRVALQDGVTLYGGVHEGWVAAGAHDGTPWLGHGDVDPGRPLPAPVTGWPTVKRGDIVLTGETIGDPEPDMGGNLAIKATMRGLLPGSMVDLGAGGTFEVSWVCNEPSEPTGSEPPLGWGVEDLGNTQGSVTTGAERVRVDSRGVATATLMLRPSRPAKPCPSGHTGPWAFNGQWDALRVADEIHGLALTPEPQRWDTTF